MQFNLPTGAWMRLLRRCGFVLQDVIEVQPPPGAETRWDFVELAWTRRWPSEELWRARKA